jgi:hypothetical protein
MDSDQVLLNYVSFVEGKLINIQIIMLKMFD